MNEMTTDCPSFGRITRTAPTVNPFHFLPTNRHRFYHYEGSLTSELFSEAVSWFVMQQEISVSPGDMRVMRKNAEQDVRAVQPLSSRDFCSAFRIPWVYGPGATVLCRCPPRAIAWPPTSGATVVE